MKEFIRLYSDSPELAKAYYYREKLYIDTTTNEGYQAKSTLLKKYLEGL